MKHAVFNIIVTISADIKSDSDSKHDIWDKIVTHLKITYPKNGVKFSSTSKDMKITYVDTLQGVDLVYVENEEGEELE